MRRVSRVFVLLLLATFWATSRGSAAGTAELLRDIDQAGFADTARIVGRLQPARDGVVFTAFFAGTGIELWGSDGSSQNTELLRELLPGPDSPQIWMLGTVRRRAVFLADAGPLEGLGLWSTDGTREGTVLLEPGLGSCFGRPEAAVFGNDLYVAARNKAGDCWLWRTNGTEARLLEEPASAGGVQTLTPAGNRLFFFGNGELWVTEGTAASTRSLGDFGSQNGMSELIAVGSRAFFIGRGASEQEEEIWVSDGTPAGTRQVSRFFEPFPFQRFDKNLLEGFEGVLYFLADDGTGLDLWRSDGTTAGTWRVTDFIATNPFIEHFDETHLVRIGIRLIFPATEDPESLRWELWESGGTPATTKRLTGCPEPGGCPQIAGGPVIQDGGRALFPSYSSEGGTHLWVTDGTGGGTRRLDRLCVGGCGNQGTFFPLLGQIFYLKLDRQSFWELWRTDGTRNGNVRLTSGFYPPTFETPFLPVAVGNRIFFTADPIDRGPQLWTSDGTPEGTGLVTLIGFQGRGSSPAGITPFLEGVIFSASEGEAALWSSDGTTAGTRKIDASAPLAADIGGSGFPGPVVSGGLAYFLKRDEGGFYQGDVWRTDGTEAGTFRVTPAGGMLPRGLLPLGNGVAFVASDFDPDTSFVNLWVSDGTEAGTRPRVRLPSAPEASWSTGSRIYFVASDENRYDQLWISDGTEAGTHPLTVFDSPAFYEQDLEVQKIGETTFFTAQRGLWKSDGTLEGTSEVSPFTAEGSLPSDLVVFQGVLYFLAFTEEGETHRGLWRSDGTAAGTFLVHPLGPATVSGAHPEPGWLTVAGDRLYFVAWDSEHGTELWKSDGTTAGTVRVSDILSGEGSSNPVELTAAPGRLFFVADDGSSGRELWESDGTEAGTRRVQDIAPGAASSNPNGLTVSGQRLFFAANDGAHGEEPWVLPLAGGAGCVTSADTLCLGGRFRVQADWREFQGNRGTGTAVALTADTGTFWFFDAANVEVILKVLDGRGLNDHHWVFYGALSSVEYVLTVTDTQTGAVRRYVNSPGRLGSVADTEAFGPRGANVANPLTFGPSPSVVKEAGMARPGAAVAPATACVASATRLCLNDGRFAVEARWKDFQGNTGTGKAVPLAGGETGYFWFFDASNVEVVLKVLDGRSLNGKFWVFYGALSSVEYTLTVTDTVTGTVKTYTNPSGKLASVADTGAF